MMRKSVVLILCFLVLFSAACDSGSKRKETLSTTTTVGAPGAPGSPSAQPYAPVQISWQPSVGGPLYYEIWRSSDGGVTYKKLAKISENLASPKYVYLDRTAPSEKLMYKVAAFNQLGHRTTFITFDNRSQP